ncbi:MAG: hypothetical protein GXY52_08790 [Chloroflexi bacterium]|mgnify:CR=1 FL=1|nr:hypothetical protein [Chloroflexota bacterium]
MQIIGDSLVLVDQEPGKLCYGQLEAGSVAVRSCYKPEANGCVVYVEGKDYIVDYAAGSIRRTADSAVPNFATNNMYGLHGFDHTELPVFSNHAHFVWVDYRAPQAYLLADANSQAHLLPRTVGMLQAGGPFKVIAYGDSITAGGEASEVPLRYQELWVAELAKRYPRAQIESENGATGGDASLQGVQRLDEKVLTRQPDLVLLAFGMNDLRTPKDEFVANMRTIIARIRAETPAEVMLISTFPPNPLWKYASGNSDEIADATRQLAVDEKAAYADVHTTWARVLRRKNLPSLLGNNINHPNDFGHWLYLQAMLAAFPG